jgi:predicted adenylyl cyclase CyaB
MREIELKGVVADEREVVARLRGRGAREVFDGTLIDRRYDTPNRALFARDEVLRVRIAVRGGDRRARLDYKGPASYPGGYKVRDEVGTDVADAEVVERVLTALGLVVTREIEREILTFHWQDAIIRFERYPRMDTLVEVEGSPESIERAIEATGIARSEFTGDRLADFVRRYEARTGMRAALSAHELTGEYRYRVDDA